MSRSGRVPWTWGDVGTTVPPPTPPGRDVRLTRAVHVDAPVDVVFRWLGQLRAGPYSYDLIDNRGRQSPPYLSRTDEVRLGQRFLIFDLVGLDAGRQLILELTDHRGLRVFGPLTLVYRAEPEEQGTTLRCDLFLPRPAGRFGSWRQVVLAWGDLVMMRRQLHNLRQLSEATARPA